jgi:transposase InsO family protein
MKYQIVAALKKKYGVVQLCRYLKCSKSGYYDWISRGKPNHNNLNELKAKAITTVYFQKKTRGRRQVQMQLSRQFGIHMSLGSVHRYMSALNIKSIRNKKKSQYVKTLSGAINLYPNIVNQNFTPTLDHEIWLTDITYISATNGRFYLSCIKNMRDKSIIAYHYSLKNDLELVMKTLRKCQANIKNIKVILHSDQGSQVRQEVA